MDPLNRGSENSDVSGMPYERADGAAPVRRPVPDAGPAGPGAQPGAAVRVATVVAGDYLLTVNPVDGSEVVMCPPERAKVPERRTAEERAARRRAARPAPTGPAGPAEQPLLEREEETERLVRLLGRGRSVRVTGPSGVGRSALLAAIADRCGGLAPDGVVQLSGYHRTPSDLLYDLYAAVYRTDGNRPERARLLERAAGIGAIVVLDDLEFGGEALEELLSAACECAFLIAVTPEVAAPSPDSQMEEVFLSGLTKAGCRELVERAVDRPLSEKEAAWVSDLWFESEGLPLRFIQAGALLKLRDAARTEAEDEDGRDDAPFGTAEDVPLPPLASGVAESLALRLGTPAREALRYALALGGECVHPSHLPALIGDTGADAAIGELAACSLITPVAAHHRLAAGAQRQLAGEVRRSAEYAKSAAQHYAWWSGHPSVTAERVSMEADTVLAVMTATRDHGQPAAAVLLARSAAPAFAAALNWSAWERALRIGQEAARQAGEVAEEAYFHHELGVLALCSGNLERARTELEASIGMRGVLADRQGTVVGRRTLALVADRVRGLAPTPAADGEGLAAAAVPTAQLPTARIPQIPADPFTTAATVVTPAVRAPGIADTVVTRRADAFPPPPRRRGLALSGSRRNLAAASAGALLVALLGTVVTLSTTSGSGTPQPNPAISGPTDSATLDGTGGLPADQPTDGSSASHRPSAVPGGAHHSPSASAGTADPGRSTLPTAGVSPSAPPPGGGTGQPTPKPTQPTTPVSSSSTPASPPTTTTSSSAPTTPTSTPSAVKTNTASSQPSASDTNAPSSTQPTDSTTPPAGG